VRNSQYTLDINPLSDNLAGFLVFTLNLY